MPQVVYLGIDAVVLKYHGLDNYRLPDTCVGSQCVVAPLRGHTPVFSRQALVNVVTLARPFVQLEPNRTRTVVLLGFSNVIQLGTLSSRGKQSVHTPF